MENEMIPLSDGDRFAFCCSPEVSCFNECCRDLNQFLTPYDVLCLKNHLGLRSDVFLDRYTTQHIGPETGLPVVVLKQESATEFKCPFVTPKGCSVYEARPASCRTYPLARLASRSPETGRIQEQYVLLKEPHCRGFDAENRPTAREWVQDQGLEPYNEMNDLLMEIIGLKRRRHPEPLDMKERRLFRIACYDLDAFRSQVFEKGELQEMNPPPEWVKAAREDDAALLRLSLKWVKRALFGEPRQ